MMRIASFVLHDISGPGCLLMCRSPNHRSSPFVPVAGPESSAIGGTLMA
jgi:hypothetical protein